MSAWAVGFGPDRDRPLLLDLYCGGGGAAMGYWSAEFDVIGVDSEPQPLYPFRFYQADALEFVRQYGGMFAAIHASPPCQAYCAPTQYNRNRDTYPDLVGPTRDALNATGLPWIIENTPGAPLRDPVILCGSMFGLKLYRHRLFESNAPLTAPEHPKHAALCARNGVLPSAERPYMTITGGKHSKAWTQAAARAMGVPWLRYDLRAVCEAIPPAYTHHVGEQLIEAAAQREAA